MRDKIVYLVVGETGEYSDRQDWPVAVFTEKEKAIIYKELCEKEIEHVDPRKDHLSQITSRFDPDLQMDYTGTQYSFNEVRLNPKVSNAKDKV